MRALLLGHYFTHVMPFASRFPSMHNLSALWEIVGFFFLSIASNYLNSHNVVAALWCRSKMHIWVLKMAVGMELTMTRFNIYNDTNSRCPLSLPNNIRIRTFSNGIHLLVCCQLSLGQNVNFLGKCLPIVFILYVFILRSLCQLVHWIHRKNVMQRHHVSAKRDTIPQRQCMVYR